MRCEKCKQYVPEGLGIKNCPECGTEIKENEKNIISASEIEDFVSAEQKNKQDKVLSESQPEYKLIKLNKDQLSKIESRLSKEFNSMLLISIVGLLIIIGSFIPAGFFPKSYRYHDLDKNSTLIETMGIVPTIIFWIIFGLIIYLAGLRKNIFFKLKKDLFDTKVYTFETKIIRIEEFKGDSEKEYDVYIEKNNANIEKLNYLISEFPNLTKGEIINVSITQNAHFVIKTEKPLLRKKKIELIGNITKNMEQGVDLFIWGWFCCRDNSYFDRRPLIDQKVNLVEFTIVLWTYNLYDTDKFIKKIRENKVKNCA